MKIKLHLLVAADPRLRCAVTLLSLLTGESVGNGGLCGLVSGLFDPWGRRLGDLGAGTMVVHVPKTRRLPVMAADGVLAPLLPLRPEEQAAIVAFAERAPRLTPERQQELADIAAPATGAQGLDGVRRLAGIAHWLLGKR